MSRDLTHLPTQWDEPDGEGSNKTTPSDSNQEKSFNLHYAGTFVAKRMEAEKNAVDEQNAASNSNKEPSPLEASMKFWEFIKEPKHANAIMAIFTILIGFATGGYAIIAIFQWQTMQTSNEILKLTQQPFVGFLRIDTARDKINGQHIWLLTPYAENSGATPALDVISYQASDLLTDEPSESQFLGHSDYYPSIVIGAKATQEMNPITEREISIFGVDLDTLKNEHTFHILNKRWFVWGWIAYTDSFQAPHLTEFCLGASFATRQADGSFQTQLSSCRTHNCADEHCQDHEELTAFVDKARNLPPPR